MKVVITGAEGFIGKNLRLKLKERHSVQVISFTRADALERLPQILDGADFVFHLAGVNRPKNASEFEKGNAELTKRMLEALPSNRPLPRFVYTSSTQACLENVYGNSKRRAEQILIEAAAAVGLAVDIFRLPNVFGKWSRPNYNSVVATFCHNIACGLPIQIHDSAAPISLCYVDDVVSAFLAIMDGQPAEKDAAGFCLVKPLYTVTVGELASSIRAFHENRETLLIERVGTGLERALYSTYLSFLPPSSFTYPVPQYEDERGVFVEMLKTRDSGQFSFFTAHPGITRGGHYHHTKTEKFLVIRGRARFRFRSMDTGQYNEVLTCGDRAEIVETVPGWTHDITNIGENELIVMLWTNEIFDRARPDTYACPVGHQNE